MARVGVQVQFDGVSRGAVTAAQQTRLALHGVSTQATQTSQELGKTSQQVTRLEHNTRRGKNEVDRFGRGLLAGSGFAKSFGRSVAFASGAFLGGAGLIAVVKGGFHEMGGLISQTRRAGTVFGESAGVIRAWARTTATSIGLSRRESLEAANNFGTFQRAVGLTSRSAATMSKSLVVLAANIAALHGADPQDVLQTLEIGLRGRTRGLKEYGIIIDDDRIKAEALRLGLVKLNVDQGKLADAQTRVAIAQAKVAEARRKYGAGTTQVASAELQLHSAEEQLHKTLGGTQVKLTSAQRALATYKLIVQQTADAHGYFGRHISDAYEQERIFHAQTRQLQGLLGQGLMPVLVQVLRQVNAWLASSKNQRQVQETLHTVIGNVVTVVKLLVAGIRIVDGVTGSFKRTVELLIALKMATVISGWAGALGFSKGGLAANLGIATGETKGLRGALARLPRRLIIQVAIATAIYGPAKRFFEQQLGADYSGIQPDVPGRSKSPYPRGGNLDRLYQAGYNQAKVGTVGGYGGKTTGDLDAAERRAYQQGAQAGRTAPGSRKARSTANAIAATAATQIGIPYTWGGPAILGHSTDCSGLAQAVLAKNGIHVGRTTYVQWHQGRPVDPKHLQPGDLVFFHMGPRGPEHVGIYIGNGQFIEDPHTGTSVRVSNLAGRRDFVGARRYIPNVLGGGTAPPQQPGGVTGPPAPTTAPPRPKGPLHVGTTTAAAKGATLPTIIGIRASIDAQLRQLQNLSPEVSKYLSPLAGIAERHLEQLRAHLRKGLSAADIAKTRAGIQRWGKVLRDEIQKAKDKAAEAARQAAEEAARAFDRQFRDFSTTVFRQFDGETDRYVKSFQRDTDRALAEMRKSFDRQMRPFDAETQRGLQGFVVPQTGAEAALASFQAARQAEADAKAMADAQASGDPEQVRQLQLDLQERALEEAAKQSRDAQDKATEEQQRNYQQQRDDLRAALDEQEAAREQAYTDSRDATLLAYQQARDDQRQHLQDDLDDWMLWIQQKKKTWADFLRWLAGEGFVIPTDMLHQPDELIANQLWNVGVRPTGLQEGAGFARGGTIRAPRFMGRGDVLPAMLSAGETVIDRSLTAALEQMVTGGGNAPTFNFDGATFIGAPNRDAASAWARDMQDALGRLVGYRNKLT